MRKFQIIFKCRACSKVHCTIIEKGPSRYTNMDIATNLFVTKYSYGEKLELRDCGTHIGICELICIQEVS